MDEIFPSNSEGNSQPQDDAPDKGVLEAGAADEKPESVNVPELPTHDSKANVELGQGRNQHPDQDGQELEPVPKEAEVLPTPQRHILRTARAIEKTDFPDVKVEKGSKSAYVQTTLPNLSYMLRRYGITVVYDIVKKKTRIHIPGHTGTNDNADNTAVTVIMSLAVLNDMSTALVPLYVEAIADSRPYNPVAEWVASKPWDKVDRLEAIYATLQVREDFPEDLKKTLIRKWLLSAVAAALMPSGFKTRGVLTFQGGQGIGKTSWVRSLVHDPALSEEFIKVDHLLDVYSKDSVTSAISHWIVELGELDSSFKRDMSRLKGFLTSDSDKIRRLYQKADSEYARRTVFCATVNDENFLIDSTGNSRFWVLPLVNVNYIHGIDTQQLFAQLAEDFHAKAEWWLTKDEEALLEKQNARHRAVSVVRDSIVAALDLERKDHPDLKAFTANEVLKAIDIEHPTNGQSKEASQVLRELLGEPRKHSKGYVWRVPFRLESLEGDADA